MSEGNLRRAVQNLKKKAVVSQNAFFFKIIIVFFLSYFFLAKLVSFFQSSMSVKRSAILQRQKKYSAAGMITTVTKGVLPLIFKLHLQIKINIFWKSLLDTVHCAFQTFQIFKINQLLLF